jgi:bla regulator protein BlaR1
MNAPFIAEFLTQLVQATGHASALALVVWLVIHALGEHLNAEWRCRLWLLVIVRLAWPVSLPSPVSLFNLFAAPATWSDPEHSSRYLADELLVQLGRWLEQPWVSALWLVGAGLLLVRALVAVVWAFWVRTTARSAAGWEAWWLLEECKEASGLRDPVVLLESGRVSSPCLVGLFRPALVLPEGLWKELSPNELRLILLHELAHLRRRDLALNWVLAMVGIFHWFNPVVWVVTKKFRADREEACDACALAVQPEARREYGQVLLKLLERDSPAIAPPALPAVGILGDGAGDVAPLVHRLQAIMKFRPGTRTWVVGFCTWLAVALIGLTDPLPRPVADTGEDLPPTWVARARPTV